jgi:hypothetical protein
MLPEKLQVTLKLKKFSAFYGNWRFITTFKSVHYWSISESQMNESDTLLTCLFTVYLYSLKSLPLRFLTKISSTILFLTTSQMCEMKQTMQNISFSHFTLCKKVKEILTHTHTHTHTCLYINKYIYLHLFIYLLTVLCCLFLPFCILLYEMK